jgi:hypothetical protein
MTRGEQLEAWLDETLGVTVAEAIAAMLRRRAERQKGRHAATASSHSPSASSPSAGHSSASE